MPEKRTPSKQEFAVPIDLMYQDKWIDFLNKISQPTWIKFLDAKVISRKLLQKISSPEDFLQEQLDLVYGDPTSLEHRRKSVIDIAGFKRFIEKFGFKIKEKVIDHDGNTCLLIYKTDPSSEMPLQVEMDGTELPAETERFYRGETNDKFDEQRVLAKHMGVPVVLNIGSGADENRQIPHAINGDLSPVGKPQVVFDAKLLPFPDNSMTMIMASHVFEHLTFSEALEAISEWLRVLHPEGILRIAVPDGKITLSELEEGFTQKGEPSYGFPGGSAPLTQLQGLGGENSKTDSRWRHQVLYTFELLEKIIKQNNHNLEVRLYSEEDSLSKLSGIKLDETNRYSLRIEIQKRKEPHFVPPEMTQDEYFAYKKEFLASNQQEENPMQPLSIIIPIHNEEEGLPAFFKDLDESLSELKSFNENVEVIFVLNGCDDRSEELVDSYMSEHGETSFTKTFSEKGILKAFASGIHSRKLNGSVAKLDVDTSYQKWTLSYMYMYLFSKKDLQVTYAEVLPSEDRPVIYNLAEYFQNFRSKRNYFHGRMSLYRTNPFDLFKEELIMSTGVLTEDVIFSCLFAYYRGLNSIESAPGAIVKSTSLNSYEKLYRNWARARVEIKKICDVFPQFEVLKNVLQRKVINPEPSLEQENPELYFMWLTYLHLHQSLAAAAKASSHYTGDGTLFGPEEIHDRDSWGIRT